MKKNKIQVALIFRAPAGGIRKHILALVAGLPTANYDFFLITNLADADADFNFFQAKTPSNCTVLNATILNSPGFSDIKILLKLFNSLRKLKIDVFHGHGAKGGMYARVLGAMLGKKVIYTPHGGSLHNMHGRFFSYLYSIIEWSLYPLTNIFVFESNYSLKMYQSKIFKTSSKYLVNLNGVIPSKTNPTRPQLLNIASFSALRKIKGIDVAIRAIKILTLRGHKLNYTIYGSGEEYPHLNMLVQKLDLTHQIVFKGEVGNCRSIMRDFDAILQPSYFESFGYTLIEGMAEGLIPIAANTGGMIEIIEDQINGYLFKTGSPESLADTIEIILSKPTSSLNKIRQQGQIKIRQDFNEIKMTENLNSIYKNLLNFHD